VTFADAVPSCDACRKLIGVDEGASSGDIKRAYHQKALESHPDKNPDDSMAQENFMRVQGCYEALTKSKCTDSNWNYGDAFDFRDEDSSFSFNFTFSEFIEALRQDPDVDRIITEFMGFLLSATCFASLFFCCGCGMVLFRILVAFLIYTCGAGIFLSSFTSFNSSHAPDL